MAIFAKQLSKYPNISHHYLSGFNIGIFTNLITLFPSYD